MCECVRARAHVLACVRASVHVTHNGWMGAYMATNIRHSISIFNRLRGRESRCQPPMCPTSPDPTLVSDNHISQQFVKFVRGPVPRIPMRPRRRQHLLPPCFPARGRRRTARPSARLLAALPLDRLVNTVCVGGGHVSVCQRCACACVCVRVHAHTWQRGYLRPTAPRSAAAAAAASPQN